MEKYSHPERVKNAFRRTSPNNTISDFVAKCFYLTSVELNSSAVKTIMFTNKQHTTGKEPAVCAHMCPRTDRCQVQFRVSSGRGYCEGTSVWGHIGTYSKGIGLQTDEGFLSFQQIRGERHTDRDRERETAPTRLKSFFWFGCNILA